MIEITNRQFGPIQLMIKSRKKVNSFTTLIIPGRGAEQNVRIISDEDITEDVIRAERERKQITTRRLTNK